MRQRPPTTLAIGLVLAIALVCVGGVKAAGAAHAGSSPPQVGVSDTTLQWQDLALRQRTALQPLASQWHTLDASGKEKWLAVADRYWSLPSAEQKLIQTRMTQWARLQPRERGEARLRFQQTRQLSAAERQEKWAAYQSLTDEQKRGLARVAQRQAKPVILPDNVPGPREAQQAFAKRGNMSSSPTRKSNVVPATLPSAAPSPVAVAPTLIKAGAGATTNLVNQRPHPPQFQQSGLPKITATQGFVDPMTLLPKRGEQGAAMAPQSAASKPAAKAKH